MGKTHTKKNEDDPFFHADAFGNVQLVLDHGVSYIKTNLVPQIAGLCVLRT